MKPITIWQSDSLVPPGTIVDYLDDHQIPFRLIEGFTEDIEGEVTEFGALITLGSRGSACGSAQAESTKKMLEFISRAIAAKLPVLGICFGSQMLAKALGAEVTRGEVMELGQGQVKLTDQGLQDSCFEGYSRELVVFQCHQDRWTLPEGAELLASSEVCSSQAFRRGQAVGIQFHPEVNREIVEGWADDFPPEIIPRLTSRNKFVEQYDAMAAKLKRLNYQILDGWLSNSPTKNGPVANNRAR